MSFTESGVEEAARAWPESSGWQVRHGAESVPGEPAAERDDYGEVVLTQRLRDALLQQHTSGQLRIKEAARGIKETTA